jgi:hypothetical protein
MPRVSGLVAGAAYAPVWHGNEGKAMSEVPVKNEGAHPCWAKVNAAIKPRNAELDMAMTINLGSNKTGSALYIPLRKVNSRKKGGLTKIAPLFCPFCGGKFSE